MASRKEIVWECDACQIEQGSASTKEMPPAWTVLHIISEKKIFISMDICPLCLNDVEKALSNPTRKVQHNG